MSTPSDFNFPDLFTLLHAEPKDDFFQYSKFQPPRGLNNSLNSYELYNAIANATLIDLIVTTRYQPPGLSPGPGTPALPIPPP
ncbi:hypothetical protein C0993_007510 [Termitomyces sp. T159_Od127]|nr:hypothetical protein C0993_007510 [Termitomyces sp. T159_Od127]